MKKLLIILASLSSFAMAWDNYYGSNQQPNMPTNNMQPNYGGSYNNNGNADGGVTPNLPPNTQVYDSAGLEQPVHNGNQIAGYYDEDGNYSQAD